MVQPSVEPGEPLFFERDQPPLRIQVQPRASRISVPNTEDRERAGPITMVVVGVVLVEPDRIINLNASFF